MFCPCAPDILVQSHVFSDCIFCTSPGALDPTRASINWEKNAEAVMKSDTCKNRQTLQVSRLTLNGTCVRVTHQHKYCASCENSCRRGSSSSGAAAQPAAPSASRGSGFDPCFVRVKPVGQPRQFHWAREDTPHHLRLGRCVMKPADKLHCERHREMTSRSCHHLFGTKTLRRILHILNVTVKSDPEIDSYPTLSSRIFVALSEDVAHFFVKANSNSDPVIRLS